MNSKRYNESLRQLYIGGVWQTFFHQVDDIVEEKHWHWRLSIGPVTECPCGCGLQGDVCNTRIDAVRIENEEMQF